MGADVDWNTLPDAVVSSWTGVDRPPRSALPASKPVYRWDELFSARIVVVRSAVPCSFGIASFVYQRPVS